MHTYLLENTPLNYCSIRRGQFRMPSSLEEGRLTSPIVSNSRPLSFYLMLVSIVIYATLVTCIWILPVSPPLLTLACLVIMATMAYIGRWIDWITSYIGTEASGMLLYSVGNIPELVVSLTALHHRQSRFVTEFNYGSIIVNTLVLSVGVFLLKYCRRPKLVGTYPKAISKCTEEEGVVREVLDQGGSEQGKPEQEELNQEESEQDEHHPDYLVFVVFLYLITSFISSSYASLCLGLVILGGNIFLLESWKTNWKPAPAWVYLASLLMLIGSSIIVNRATTIIILYLDQKDPRSTIFNMVALPLLGNLSECYGACHLAWHGDINAALRLGINSAQQIAWLLFPINIVVGALTYRSLPLETIHCAVVFGLLLVWRVVLKIYM